MIIGIYGNIGSGKTTLAKYLAKKYHFVYLSLDELAHNVIIENQTLKTELLNLKDQQIVDLFDENQNFDFQKLANYIFLDKKKNHLISSIIWKYLKIMTDEIILVLKSEKVNLLIEGAVLPSANLTGIDSYLYLANPKMMSKWSKNRWKKTISQERNRSLKELNSVIKIQNEYNLHHQIDYFLVNNPRTMKTNDLFIKGDELIAKLLQEQDK